MANIAPHVFTADYFESRKGNDKLRQKSFDRERKFILKCLKLESLNGLTILDVGCSTGEFAKRSLYDAKLIYGLEPSTYAANIAKNYGVKIINNFSELTQTVDIVIFRGTLQYIPEPFEAILNSYSKLTNNGAIIFLCTPNARSLIYFLSGDLPFLEHKYMYYIPSDVSLRMNLQNAGFINIKSYYPYLSTPYAKPLKDFCNFILLLLNNKRKFAWPGNIVEIVGFKPNI